MLELRCNKNANGTYNAGIFQNDRSNTDYRVKNGTCEDIRKLHQRALNDFGEKEITIGSECSECIK